MSVNAGLRPVTRYAVITVSKHTDSPVERIKSYLPGNYTVVGMYETEDEWCKVLIAGNDSAGWTMDDYVLPRLGSGLYFGIELVPADSEYN